MGTQLIYKFANPSNLLAGRDRYGVDDGDRVRHRPLVRRRRQEARLHLGQAEEALVGVPPAWHCHRGALPGLFLQEVPHAGELPRVLYGGVGS